MLHILTLIISLLLPISTVFTKDLFPNTGDIKLNSNINMHTVVGHDVGCWPNYLWHHTYGGCRMRGANLVDSEAATCELPKQGTRTRSRYREQWIQQGSGQVALSTWGSWGEWDESKCESPSPECRPEACANRAHLHAYSMDEGQGGGESLTPVLAYVHCTLYRNSAVLIDRHVFVNAVYFHKDSLQANHAAQACNQVVAEIQSWGIGASIDYASIDWNATMGWARVNYW